MEERSGVGIEVWGDDDLAEDLADGACEGFGEGAIGDDDAAEGGLFIGVERLVPCEAEVFIGADPAGVGVFEDGDGGVGEFLDEFCGGRDVEDVVVGKFFPVELLEEGVEVSVQSGGLVGVLAVAKACGAGQGDVEGAGSVFLFIEVVGDGSVVAGGGDEDLDAEAFAQLRGGGALVCAHGFEDGFVVGRVDDDGDGAMVFGGGPEHGGAADVDVLDGFFHGDIGFSDGGFERVEVYDDEIDGEDPVLVGGLGVFVVIADPEQAAVDFWVQGFDAAVHHLWEAGVIGDLAGGDIVLVEKIERSSGGDDFDAHFDEGFGEVDETGFIGDGDESPLDFHVGGKR